MHQLEQTVQQNLEALCADHAGPIGLAVSGGGDSLALLYIATDWARRTGRSLLSLTVDHGLRPEAALEAEAVGRHCAGLDIVHRTLNWRPPEGHIGQARSRRARHMLLADAIRSAGGALILMGHTRDDQFETIAMRAARRDTGAGLAGIRRLAVSPVWPEGRDVFIGRPCLEVRREDLRGCLRQRGVDWVDDPSNLDRQYERVRVRQSLCAHERAPVVSLKAMQSAQISRAAQDGLLAKWLREAVQARADGLIQFEVGALDPSKMTSQVLAEGLAWLLMAAAGSDRRADRRGRLLLADDILARPRDFRARTLGGAWIAPRQGFVNVARDPGEVDKMPIMPKSGMVWDGRFLFEEYAENRENMKFPPNLAPNLQICPEYDEISPMARRTCPVLETTPLKAVCLVSWRLKQVEFMLDYDNLINEGTKIS